MKTPLLLLLLAATAAFAQDPAPAAKDPELQAILAKANASRSNDQTSGTPRERVLAAEAQARSLLEQARAYLATHPSGQGRAEVVLAVYARSPRFINSVDPRFDQEPGPDHVVMDEAARDAFTAEMRGWLSAIRGDQSVESETRIQAGRSLAVRAINETATTAQLDEVQKLIEQLAAEGLDEGSVQMLQSRMFYPYASRGLAGYEAYLARLGQNSNAVIREVAAEAKAKFERQRDELGRIKFTAADGREVDLAQWRGKVVLIDFWATWCVPCIAEFPHLKKLYAEYHGKGLEIVGLTLENPRITPSDTPEQKTAKLQKAKQVLLASIQKHQLPWPQHFDGENSRNELSTHFGIQEIPATFLFDQNGKLVSANARGERLEAEIKRLLQP